MGNSQLLRVLVTRQWHLSGRWDKRKVEVFAQYNIVGTDWGFPAAQCAGYSPMAPERQKGAEYLGVTEFWKIPCRTDWCFPAAHSVSRHARNTRAADGKSKAVQKGEFPTVSGVGYPPVAP